jgi:hypothetical protein
MKVKRTFMVREVGTLGSFREALSTDRSFMKDLRWRQDAFWKVSGVSDIPVPQGRGHLRFRSHWKESQEKPTLDKNRARTKTDRL